MFVVFVHRVTGLRETTSGMGSCLSCVTFDKINNLTPAPRSDGGLILCSLTNFQAIQHGSNSVTMATYFGNEPGPGQAELSYQISCNIDPSGRQ